MIDSLVYRLILHEKRDGGWNMAADHALLDGMGAPDARPVIRLYGFSPPTLSLGRFQRARQTLDVDAARRDGLTVVRRPTGGQAVLHDGELTYAVLLGRAHLAAFSKREVYRTVARALLAALSRLGIPVLLAGERQGALHNPDCFRSTGEYEVTAEDGRKLVGSAQIVTRAGALQHGAIPLDQSNRTIARYLRLPVAAGVADRGAQERGRAAEAHDSTCVAEILGTDPGFPSFRDALAGALGGTVGVRRDEMSPRELERADFRLRELYGTDQWNLEP